ncbi:DUF6522 family protein [Pontibaca salina]|uniref:Uncharacterized protein n=1 Tax=Pontibaca salina TaxID=2795731 RepID=A0A934LZB6_9RHOB|nr:DUF6522 family protein [Pontibaca salina]MBI6628825.1 hypothetical protein [Pontibaca salina]
MTRIEIAEDVIVIDAQAVASGLQIDAAALKQGMRDGSITSRCERGEGEDAGRVRVTFFSPARRMRITADDAGNILTCSSVGYTRRPS